MEATQQSNRGPDKPVDHGLERRQLRAALIASMRSLESAADTLARLGYDSEARVAQASVEVAQATLNGPAAVDELWKQRKVGQQIAGTTRTV